MHKVQTTTTKVFEVTHTFSFLHSESIDSIKKTEAQNWNLGCC